VAWHGYIAGPDTSFTNATVGIFGSAWIDQGPLGNPVDFVNYSLAWQNPFVSTTWYPIVSDSALEIRNSALGVWNTTGRTPGTYILRLTIESNTGDTIDCLRIMTLLPGVQDVNENTVGACSVYPNPANNMLFVNAPSPGIMCMYTAEGRTVEKCAFNSSAAMDVSQLPPGVYLWTITLEDGIVQHGRLVKE
jgi:hypothetical protein